VNSYRHAVRGSLEVRILGRARGDAERLAEKLGDLGVPFTVRGPIESSVAVDGKVATQVSGQLDAAIFRAIAKIAFNYVACVYGAEFILRSDFDFLRVYIRYGTEPPWPAVRPTNEPILSLDSRRYRQTNGHLITFDWNLSQLGLLAQVSLFNHMTYRVLFCPYYSGIWTESIRSGHHFDFEDGVISPLMSASPRLAIRTG
jgi:hypothetical protein